MTYSILRDIFRSPEVFGFLTKYVIATTATTATIATTAKKKHKKQEARTKCTIG
jgi:hypothetical protein